MSDNLMVGLIALTYITAFLFFGFLVRDCDIRERRHDAFTSCIKKYPVAECPRLDP